MASILMVAGEGLPFIKTGGLADVIGSLPKALTERGHEVKVVMPLYKKLVINTIMNFILIVNIQFQLIIMKYPYVYSQK